MPLPTVERACDHLAESGTFGRISASRHALGQTRKFRAGELAFGIEAIRKPDNLDLLLRWQGPDLINDLSAVMRQVYDLGARESNLERKPHGLF